MIIKQVMVMGAGAVGGYFGGKLALKGKTKISFVARGEHLKKIKEKGLIVESIDGDFKVRGEASDNPLKLPEPDIILFTVKSHDTEQAIQQISPIITKDTYILPLQNGIENFEKLENAFGEQRLVRGLCRIGARIQKPGVISHTNPGSVMIGERNGQLSGRIKLVYKMFQHADVNISVVDDIEREIWIKFVWNTLFNILTAVENCTTDKLFDDGKMEDRLHLICSEILKIAEAESVRFDKEDVNHILMRTKKLGEFITSTLNDRRKNKKLEYDAFTGALLRLAKKHQLKLPEIQKLHTELEKIDYEMGYQ